MMRLIGRPVINDSQHLFPNCYSSTLEIHSSHSHSDELPENIDLAGAIEASYKKCLLIDPCDSSQQFSIYMQIVGNKTNE